MESIELLISISFVSALQHLEDWLRVLRQISIAILNSERVPSPDRKPFAPVPYLFLRSIGFSQL